MSRIFSARQTCLFFPSLVFYLLIRRGILASSKKQFTHVNETRMIQSKTSLLQKLVWRSTRSVSFMTFRLLHCLARKSLLFWSVCRGRDGRNIGFGWSRDLIGLVSLFKLECRSLDFLSILKSHSNHTIWHLLVNKRIFVWVSRVFEYFSRETPVSEMLSLFDVLIIRHFNEKRQKWWSTWWV